jgi:hypothetical protein
MYRILLRDASQLFRKRLRANHRLSGQLAHPRQQRARIVE